AGVARGFFSLEQMMEIDEFLKQQLAKSEVKLDSHYYCPFITEEYAMERKIPLNSPWIDQYRLRKPQIGMLAQACKDFNLNLQEVQLYFIGDKKEDVLTGINAGGKGIWVVREDNKYFNERDFKEIAKKHPEKIHKAQNMIDAIYFLLKDRLI
ncbi:MAG: HAD hydrolase-like protein, partial [Nanoarchaeota archaeon]